VRAGGSFAVEGQVRALSILPAGLEVQSVAEHCKTSHLDAATPAGTAGTWIA